MVTIIERITSTWKSWQEACNLRTEPRKRVASRRASVDTGLTWPSHSTATNVYGNPWGRTAPDDTPYWGD